ncbi:MAG: ROK family transcriptional regulator [Acidobacteria bacterium]|nr:ROK family transcriptional regulator [Acidobacteriota bacterium]
MRKINLSNFQVAKSETARDINRRIILNLIRTRQPISRADLARLTDLQRSTVSLIIEQLIEEQWITEGALGHLPRGRKPRFLHLNSERAGIIGVDVRPKLTTIALTDLNANFITQDSLPTLESAEEFLTVLARKIKKMRDSHPQIFCEGIGVGVPGRVERKSRKLVFAPNLGWRNVNFKDFLETETNLPVEVDNGANSCALFELWFGKQSEGVHDLIALTVSEGIGTGIIANDQLLTGVNGMAGEFGHISINENGPLCSCGNRGCWEVYASNSATVDYYSETTVKSQNGRKTDDSMRPTFDDVLRLYELGDAKAVESVERMAHYLGIGIAMLITSLAPSLIVCVGEITRVWEKIEPIIIQAVEEKNPLHTKTRIIPTNDQAYPRLRGSIALILQQHFVAPPVA